MTEFLLFEDNFDRLKSMKEDEWYPLSGVLYNKNDMEKGKVETFVAYRYIGSNTKKEFLKCEILEFIPTSTTSFKMRVKVLDK